VIFFIISFCFERKCSLPVFLPVTVIFIAYSLLWVGYLSIFRDSFLFIGLPVHFFRYTLHIMHINICMQYDINNFGYISSRPSQWDCHWDRDISYTLSRINVGRRVSPQSLYSKKNYLVFTQTSQTYFIGIDLVPSYILHSALCTNRLCGYPNTNTHIDLEERGCKYFA